MFHHEVEWKAREFVTQSQKDCDSVKNNSFVGVPVLSATASYLDTYKMLRSQVTGCGSAPLSHLTVEADALS